MAASPISTKSCSVCREIKPFDAFGKDRSRRYGLSSRCKPCHAAHVKAWQEKNPERVRAKSLAFRKRNPEKAKGYWRAFYYANVSRKLAWSRDHYLRTRDKRRAQAAQWKKANPDRCHEHGVMRRALIYGTKVERGISFKAIVERDGGKCWMCGIEPKGSSLHFDHVIPLSKGGTHTFENIRVSCAPCNLRKGARIYPVAA